MQKKVEGIMKDGQNQSDKYDFASDESVLDKFRPMMDEYSILLIPRVVGHELREGSTKSGTARYLTEVDYEMVWHDVESGEELIVPSYAQGVDLAGEKGVGKAATYNEKYFLLKFFHVPTKKDDPDNEGRTGTGEKKQRGTQAAKENAIMYRSAIPAMMNELYRNDVEKIKAAYVASTASKSRGYAGVDNIDGITDAALPVVYGKISDAYEKRVGHKFEFHGEGE